MILYYSEDGVITVGSFSVDVHLMMVGTVHHSRNHPPIVCRYPGVHLHKLRVVPTSHFRRTSCIVNLTGTSPILSMVVGLLFKDVILSLLGLPK